MTIEGTKFYPGETASPELILKLANEYRISAETLRKCGRRGHPISLAPFRMVSIHSIELYLNAILLTNGHSSATIRGLHHNLAARTELAIEASLRLKERTRLHLKSLSGNREYLLSRYDPETTAVSQLNRLTATLDELSAKATAIVHSASKPEMVAADQFTGSR